MVSVDQLTVSFGGFDLLKGISFLVNPKDRIGLVGKNGAGKSTLLKIIAGLQQATSGIVVVPRDATIGYLPQQMKVADLRTVKEEALTAFEHLIAMEQEIENINLKLAEREDYDSPKYLKLINKVTELSDRLNVLGGSNFEAELEKTLLGLGFLRSDFDRPTAEFSGGWRMRIELAKILLKKPTLFLLDEPTNHLDIESIQWFEDFLKEYPGAVVLVSHDKAFLDNVTNRTVEIMLGNIYDYKTNYSNYIKLREERREQQLAAYRNQQKMIEDTEKFIERFRYKATKAVQVQSRIKQLEKVERIEVEEQDNSRLNIKFPPAPRSGTVVVEAKGLSKSYDDLPVLKYIDLTVERGNRVAFVGKNGEGKTTLARIIMGEIGYDGYVQTGHNVKIGYFAQNQASLLDENLTVFDTIDKVAVGDARTKIRDILGAFMFSGEDVEKKVKVLSGGERSRLAMIRLLLEPVNLLVLDEPTNHLDMNSKEILKQALINFGGTLLIVSHDREFLDGLVDVVYEFGNKKIKQHLGGIYDFLRTKKLDSLKELERNSNPKPGLANDVKKKRVAVLSYEGQKEINKNISKFEKGIGRSEERIAALEEEQKSLDDTLSKPENAEDEKLFTRYEEIKKDTEKELLHWEELHEQLELWKAKKTW